MAKPKDVIRQIQKAARRKFSADEKIRIVLEGLRGETPISEICRREGIASSVYYKWSKAFLEAGKNRKLCLYGAFNYKTGQVHYMTNPKKNADCFAQFLRQLLSANKNRFLVLALDNASYHRTSEILDVLTEHENHVFVVWLPKYSPELNMIEGLWGYLKQSALNNYFYGDLDSLEAAADERRVTSDLSIS